MGVPFINFKNNLYTTEVSINFGIIQDFGKVFKFYSNWHQIYLSLLS